jgi:hypothetical protein
LYELLATATAWSPTLPDCFSILEKNTPSLAGLFDDWKDSRYATDKSGLFAAVSRVSDMKGIMAGVYTTFAAIEPNVESRDKALAHSINEGFQNILGFIDKVAAKEAKLSTTITPAQVDELAAQAKEMADKLVPQIEQAYAIIKEKPAKTASK